MADQQTTGRGQWQAVSVGKQEMESLLGKSDDKEEVRAARPTSSAKPDRPQIGVWAFLAGGLAVALLCALGAIIWLLADDGTTTTTAATAPAEATTVTTAAPAPAPAESVPAPGNGAPAPGQVPPGPPPPPPPEAVEQLRQQLGRALGDNPIMFPAGSAELDEVQTAYIETTIAGLIGTFPGISVRIVGYPDADGDGPDLLAIERAQAVEKILLRAGVPPFAFIIESRGADAGRGAGQDFHAEVEVVER